MWPNVTIELSLETNLPPWRVKAGHKLISENAREVGKTYRIVKRNTGRFKYGSVIVSLALADRIKGKTSLDLKFILFRIKKKVHTAVLDVPVQIIYYTINIIN